MILERLELCLRLELYLFGDDIFHWEPAFCNAVHSPDFTRTLGWKTWMPELSQHFGALGSNCCAYAVHGQSRTSARDVCVCVFQHLKNVKGVWWCMPIEFIYYINMWIYMSWVSEHWTKRERERESTTSPIFFCHHSFVRSTERPMVRPCESTWRLQYDFLCLAAFSSFSLANCWTRNDTVKSLSLSQLSPKVGQSNISIHIIFSLQQMLDSARFCCQEKTGKYQR